MDDGSRLPELPEVATLSLGEGGFAAVELLGRAVELAEEGFEIRGGAEEVLQGFLFDGIHQGDEEVVGLVLILDERVLLALGAQADAFAEGVHVIKVRLPLLVDGDEHHAALLLVEHFHRQIADADVRRLP